MRDLGKRNLLGVLVDAVDYEAAVDKIMGAAKVGQGFSVTALAVHGVMTGVGSNTHRYRLNNFDLITPTGSRFAGDSICFMVQGSATAFTAPP